MHANAIGLCLALVIFFIGFNYLEGSLPSMISRRAPPDQKGAALGVYATSQFLGGFAGGTLGGFALGPWGIGGAFAVAGLLPLVRSEERRVGKECVRTCMTAGPSCH